jgi:dTDP-glucose pyrophosphorylase/CBS domain-containing protein
LPIRSVSQMKISSSQERLESVTISPSESIREAIACLDRAGTGALAVCSKDGKLAGLLTDGDIRRAILKSRKLEDSCGSIATLDPITALAPVISAEALRIMNGHDIDHLPVVDENRILQDFILRRDLGSEEDLEAAAKQRLELVIIPPATPITEAISVLDKAGTGALVLCEAGCVLSGLLTDGDIRRAILQGKSLDGPCSEIASRNPVVASRGISAREALHLMNERNVNHLPLVDAENRVVEFLLRKDVAEFEQDMSAVVMAGGFGKRLLPLTETVPKPMLPVGDRPLLELIIQRLRHSGIRDVNLTTHYLPESITDHFGDGREFGVRLNYLQEDSPMGTAGGLKLMKRPDSTFLVINGDILTTLPYQDMLVYHRQHGAVLTAGVRKHEVHVPFGVVECEDVRIVGLKEKPSLSFFINAGAYLLEPSAWDYIPDKQRFDMTDLIHTLLNAGLPVVGFPILEYWADVGSQADYQKAQESVLKGEI